MSARSLAVPVLAIVASSVLATAALAVDGLAVDGLAVDGITSRELIAVAVLAVLALVAGAVWSPSAVRSPAVGRALVGLRERIRGTITRAQQSRRAAEETQRDKEEFLAAVSHELRTPLNSIQGFAQVLLSEIDGPLTPSQREDVDAISEAGGYLKQLVDEVIDASSRRAPAEARLEAVDLGAVARSVARMIEPQRGDRAISIEVQVDDGVPPVSGDPRRLRQILINLGSNALKFTRAGHVRFHVRREGGAVRVAVEDSGPGIAPEDRERVFRAYERVDTNRGRTEGWGLGLAISREMAQWHGGSIELDSTVGVGSTFTLVLPLEAR